MDDQQRTCETCQWWTPFNEGETYYGCQGSCRMIGRDLRLGDPPEDDPPPYGRHFLKMDYEPPFYTPRDWFCGDWEAKRD